VHLIEWKEAPDERELPRGYFDHVAFSCDDLEGMIENLESLGVDYSRHRFNHQGRSITQLKMRDPTGNMIELNFSEGIEG
jgi:extradiol dioxygenase family protein